MTDKRLTGGDDIHGIVVLKNEFEELKSLSKKLNDCLPLLIEDDLEPTWYGQLIARLAAVVSSIEKRRDF